MKKRLIQIAVVVIVLGVLFNWLGQQTKLDEKRQAVEGQILLKNLQKGQSDFTLIIFDGDLCDSLKTSEALTQDISRIQSGQLLEQDLTPDVKNLISSMGVALKDLKDALSTTQGLSPTESELNLQNRTIVFSEELNRRYSELRKGLFEANRTYFLTTPKILAGLGAKGCSPALATTSPTPRASFLAKNPQFRSMNRDIANDVTCKLQTDSTKTQELLTSINRGESGVNAMASQLRTLAQHLDEASQSTEWAHEDSPLPTDASAIKQFGELSKFVYGLRVKYFQSQSQQNQGQIEALTNRIYPLAIRACNYIKASQAKN